MVVSDELRDRTGNISCVNFLSVAHKLYVDYCIEDINQLFAHVSFVLKSLQF